MKFKKLRKNMKLKNNKEFQILVSMFFMKNLKNNIILHLNMQKILKPKNLIKN